jgi:hypothetical protein
MGADGPCYSRFYADSRRKRPGFPGVCHGNQHFTGGRSGGFKAFQAQISVSFPGNSECSLGACHWSEDIIPNPQGKDGLGDSS